MDVPNLEEADWEARTSRTSFLKRVGALAAVGLGVAAALPRTAKAVVYCCPNYEFCHHQGQVNCGDDHTQWMYCQTIDCCFCWGSPNPGCQHLQGVPC